MFATSCLLTGAASAQTTYSGPITITNGGSYAGDWQSLDPSKAAVTVKTTDPVVIDGANIRSKGTLIEVDVRDADVAVVNTHGYGLNPGVTNRYPGRFLTIESPDNLRIEHNYTENTSGIYVLAQSTESAQGDAIRVRYNEAKNINGRYSTGPGYSSTEFYRVQFLQLNQVKQEPNVYVGWNQVINEPYKSRVEDNINFFRSSGTSASPIRVYNNYIQGAYPALPQTQSFSGGGIITDGESLSEVDASAWVKIMGNQVVDTTNYGLAIGNGHDNLIENNSVVSDGKMSDGTVPAAQNVGVYVNDNGDKNSYFHDNHAHGNTVGWANQDKAGGRNDFWFNGGHSDRDLNTSMSNPIDDTDEQAEWQRWLDKLSANDVVVGPVR